MSKIKELNERRAAIVADMNAITATVAQRSEGVFTAEEQEKFNELHAQRDAVDATLRAFEDKEREDMRDASEKVAKREADKNAELEERAFFKHLAGEVLTPEERTALTIDNSGVIVPNTIQQDVLIGLQGSYGILSAIDMMYTDNAGTMTFPYIISSMKLQKVAIGSAATEGEAQWNGIQLSAHDFSLPIIPVSRTLLLGSSVDVRAALINLFTELLGQALSEKIILSGDGNKDFEAFLPKVKTAVATDDASIAYTDLVNLKSKVKAPYNQMGRASFVMASSTRDALLGMVDKNGRPIYVESVAAGTPDKLFGYSVVIDDAMPEIAAGARVIAFGDFKAYKARIVRGVEVATYDESKYRVQGCVGMQAFITGDGRLTFHDGKIEPIAALAMANA